MVNVDALKPGDFVAPDPEIFSEYEEKPKLAKVERVEPHFRPGMKFVTVWGSYRNALNKYTLAVRESAAFELAKAGEEVRKLDDRIWSHRVAHLGEDVVKALGYYLGSDPEIFVEDADGKLIPAFEFLPNKVSPTRFLDQGSPQKLYWDGFQAEFTIKPQTCLAYMVDGLRQGLKATLDEARKKFPKAKLSSATVVEIPAKMLKDASEEHVALGCDPSINLYQLMGEPVPDGRDLRMRFAGGHVHLGLAKLHDLASEVVGAMDMLVGIPSVAMFDHWDSPVRRRYYGLPGEHRLPSHGLEYRVLSNAWLRHPALAHFTFDMCRIGSNFGFKGFHSLWKGKPEAIPPVILEGDVPAARQMVKDNEELFKALIQYRYASLSSGGTNAAFDAAYALMTQGAAKFLKAPDDIEANWNLTVGPWATHSENKDAQWYKASRDIVQGNKI
jgi:hypothetical protein